MCAGWNDEDEISSAELRPQVVEALLMLLSQAPLLLCHLDNDLVLVIKIIALYILRGQGGGLGLCGPRLEI